MSYNMTSKNLAEAQTPKQARIQTDPGPDKTQRKREREIIQVKQIDGEFHRRQLPFVLPSSILTGHALNPEQRKPEGEE